jgi:hypothetical protein
VNRTVRSIEILAVFLLLAATTASFAGKYKEIYFSSPKYLKRTTELWAKQSRIVGELKNPPPSFTIEIFSHSENKIVRTDSFDDNLTVYETGWLPPGTYTLEFKADGFDKSFVKSLKLQAGTDCLINVDFGKIAYNRNY